MKNKSISSKAFGEKFETSGYPDLHGFRKCDEKMFYIEDTAF